MSFDLKKEISGDFSKALLLLAEVCQRLMFPSHLSCDTNPEQQNGCRPQERCKINKLDRVFPGSLKGKREESTAVDQGKAKEDAKVQIEHPGSLSFHG